MKIAAIYSHLNGFEYIQYHQKKMWDEIESIFKNIDASEYLIKAIERKTTTGYMLYNLFDLSRRIENNFEKMGWCESGVNNWETEDSNMINKTFQLAEKKQETIIEQKGITSYWSYNQIDFLKNRVAVEIQIGKNDFNTYDLFVKHLAFYVGDAIDVGIEILPMKIMQSEMSSGPGYYEGALYDLAGQGRGVPAVPLVLIGIQP